MQEFRLGGHDGAILPLLRLANKVVAAGTQFIPYMAQHHGHRPRYVQDEPVESAVSETQPEGVLPSP
jgi:hypothetical protein